MGMRPRRDNAQASPLLGHTRGITSSYVPGHRVKIRSWAWSPPRRVRGIMRSYLKIVGLIVGLVGAYLALLPFTV